MPIVALVGDVLDTESMSVAAVVALVVDVLVAIVVVVVAIVVVAVVDGGVVVVVAVLLVGKVMAREVDASFVVVKSVLADVSVAELVVESPALSRNWQQHMWLHRELSSCTQFAPVAQLQSQIEASISHSPDGGLGAPPGDGVGAPEESERFIPDIWVIS